MIKIKVQVNFFTFIIPISNQYHYDYLVHELLNNRKPFVHRSNLHYS